MVYVEMADINNKLLDKIESDLADIQNTVDQTTIEIDAAIANSNGQKNTVAARFEIQFTQMLQELHEIADEPNKILAEFDETKVCCLEDSNDEQIVQSLKHELHRFGCSLLLSCDAKNRKLYRFEFQNEHCIVVTMNDCRLELVHMNPMTPSFALIKEYFDESQDLMKFLDAFGNLHGNVKYSNICIS